MKWSAARRRLSRFISTVFIGSCRSLCFYTRYIGVQFAVKSGQYYLFSTEWLHNLYRGCNLCPRFEWRKMTPPPQKTLFKQGKNNGRNLPLPGRTDRQKRQKSCLQNRPSKSQTIEYSEIKCGHRKTSLLRPRLTIVTWKKTWHIKRISKGSKCKGQKHGFLNVGKHMWAMAPEGNLSRASELNGVS